MSSQHCRRSKRHACQSRSRDPVWLALEQLQRPRPGWEAGRCLCVWQLRRVRSGSGPSPSRPSGRAMVPIQTKTLLPGSCSRSRAANRVTAGREPSSQSKWQSGGRREEDRGWRAGEGDSAPHPTVALRSRSAVISTLQSNHLAAAHTIPCSCVWAFGRGGGGRGEPCEHLFGFLRILAVGRWPRPGIPQVPSGMSGHARNFPFI